MTNLISFDGERGGARRNELLEDFLEVYWHLLEGEQDGFEFALLEDIHEILKEEVQIKLFRQIDLWLFTLAAFEPTTIQTVWEDNVDHHVQVKTELFVIWMGETNNH